MDTMTWWGDARLEPGQRGLWTIGALSLWLEHRAREWRLAYTTRDDPLATDMALEIPTEQAPPDEELSILRLAGAPKDGVVAVHPRLADRTIVVRPEDPFLLAPGGEAVLYVSTAAWVQVEVDEVILADVPSYRPSDTWFGETPRKGVLCYASRTSARLDLGDVPLRANRAVTRVVIRNKGEEKLSVKRINLPIPNLAVFAGPRGFLWTEDVAIECRSGGELAHVYIAHGAPADAPEAVRVGEARVAVQENVLARALHGLMS
jgi:hypothetical protein